MHAEAAAIFFLLETESVDDIEAGHNGWYGNNGTNRTRKDIKSVGDKLIV